MFSFIPIKTIVYFPNTIITVWLFCTEKYKTEVDNAERACEGCILTKGLYFEVRTAKQLVLDLLTKEFILNYIFTTIHPFFT